MKLFHFIVALSVLFVSQAALAGGPFVVTITQYEEWKDAKGKLPVSVDHANPNPGGNKLHWHSDASITTTVGWEVSVTAGSDALGLKVDGKLNGSTSVTFTTGQEDDLAAPPADNKCKGQVNHDVEFYAYEGYWIHKVKWQYSTDTNNRVTSCTVLGVADRKWTVTGTLITYKNSQQNYPDNNYPRPDPYCKDVGKSYYGADEVKNSAILKADSIGALEPLSAPNIQRKWT